MEKDKKILVINLIWLSACLAACLVASISVSWAQIPALVNIISVALSIASLILAIIAIFQSLLSNEGTHRALSDIGNAASNILEVSNKLSQDTAIFKNHFTEFGSVPTTLEALKSQIAEINVKSTTPPAIDEKDKIAGDKTNSNDFSPFVAVSSATNGAIAALYILSKANGKNIGFESTDILDQNFGMYADGVISTLIMTKFCKIEKIEGKYFVRSIEPFKSGQIEARLDKVIETNKNPEFMIKIRDRVDKFFS